MPLHPECFRSALGVSEVDSLIKVSQSSPIPSVIVSEDGFEQEVHERDSDTGSTYDGSVYGVDSHYEDSTDDLTIRGHLDLQLK